MSANRRLILKIGVVLISMGLCRFLSMGWDLTFNIEVGDIFNEQGGFCCPSSESSSLPSYLILLLRQVFWSKLLNPVLRHLISAISLPFEIGILIFSEVPLPITGRSLQRASSGEERLHGRNGRWSNDFPKGIFTLWGIPC